MNRAEQARVEGWMCVADVMALLSVPMSKGEQYCVTYEGSTFNMAATCPALSLSLIALCSSVFAFRWVNLFHTESPPPSIKNNRVVFTSKENINIILYLLYWWNTP